MYMTIHIDDFRRFTVKFSYNHLTYSFLQHTLRNLMKTVVNLDNTLLVISMVNWGDFHQRLKSEKIGQ